MVSFNRQVFVGYPARVDCVLPRARLTQFTADCTTSLVSIAWSARLACKVIKRVVYSVSVSVCEESYECILSLGLVSAEGLQNS